MGRRIVLIQGHPDGGGGHFGHALLSAYERGAKDGGHEVRAINVAALDFPILRSAREWESGALPPALVPAQESIAWAEHIAIFFPLWLGDMPALLKAFFEQIARPGFAFQRGAANPFAAHALGGRTARVVVTMGMPASVYRWYYRAHSVKSLERNILGFVGIDPVHRTLIGAMGAMSPRSSARWLAKLAELGRRGD
jgi:putative NADPH-quinone reductase